MASKDTPRSMLQAFIENVPTTAPVKRTRSRTRSPTNSQFNETVPVQKKKRKKSSFGVQQTPKSVIETYMNEHKTQTPFVRTLRRRSVSNVAMPPPKVQTKSVVTPRTALEGFINNASEETPYQKPFKQIETSELEDESDIIIPNETIHLDQTSINNEDIGPVTLPQKESRRNQFHITTTQLSQGLNNFTTDRHNTEENMFSSDDDSAQGNPTNSSLNALADSLSSESDIMKPHTDRQNNETTDNVQSISVPGKTLSASNESAHTQNKGTIIQNKSLHSQNNSKVNELVNSRYETTPLKNKSRNELVHSQNKVTPLQNELKHSLIKSPMQNNSIHSQSKLMPSPSMHSPSFKTFTAKKFNSREKTNVTENIQELEENADIANDGNVTMTKNASAAKIIEDLTPSKRRSPSVVNTQEKTPLYSNVTILENIKPLSSSTPARIATNKSAIGTPSRISVKSSTNSTPMLTPRREPLKSTINATPKRQATLSTPSQGPGRQTTLSSPRQTPGRQTTLSTPDRRTTLSSSRQITLSTPSQAPGRQTSLSTPRQTPGRQTTLSSFRQTPSRQTLVSTPRQMTGKLTTPSSSRPTSDTQTSVYSPRQTPSRQTSVSTPRKTLDRVSILKEENKINRTSEKILTNNSALIHSNNVDPRNASYTYNRDLLTTTPLSIQKSKTISRKTDYSASAPEDQHEHEDTEEPNEEEDENEEDTIDLFQLKTPHLLENISRIPTPIYSSTPAPDRHRQLVNQLPRPMTKAKTVKQKTRMVSSVLPNNVIKQAFQHFSKMRTAPDTLDELIQFTDTYFKHTFKSLEMYAAHAGRKSIDESDVELMMKRQGFISDKQPLDVLVENTLPLELRQEIIPMATAFNIIIPR